MPIFIHKNVYIQVLISSGPRRERQQESSVKICLAYRPYFLKFYCSLHRHFLFTFINTHAPILERLHCSSSQVSNIKLKISSYKKKYGVLSYNIFYTGTANIDGHLSINACRDLVGVARKDREPNIWYVLVEIR